MAVRNKTFAEIQADVNAGTYSESDMCQLMNDQLVVSVNSGGGGGAVVDTDTVDTYCEAITVTGATQVGALWQAAITYGATLEDAAVSVSLALPAGAPHIGHHVVAGTETTTGLTVAFADEPPAGSQIFIKGKLSVNA